MTVLPPAPNWFSAQILNSTSKGYVAYGAKNSIVVLKCKPQSHFCDITNEEKNTIGDDCPKVEVPECIIASSAFSERAKVTSVCWSPDSSKLAATSDDGFVKIFSVEDSIVCSYTHTVHRDIGRERHKVNAVSWSKANKDTVISGDETGNLVILDTRGNTTRSINFGKHCIYVLECHPFDGDVVAFGCRLGLVFIVNITGYSGKIIQKIRGHDQDIQGLSWAPMKYRTCFFEESPSINEGGDNLSSASYCKIQDVNYQEDQLVAISSREQLISVWSIKSGRQIAVLRLPGAAGERSKNKYMSDKQTFSALHWWKSGVLLSSGVNGELLEWNLTQISQHGDGLFKSTGDGPEIQILHTEHSRILYSINATGNSIQTVGQDRCIVSFNRKTRLLDFNLPAFGSWIYSAVANNVDPKIIALAAGDGLIRIWKIGSDKAMFDVNVMWQKLNNAKVTALAWHPDKDNIIAFATDEGRVGFADAFSPRSIPTFSTYNHRSMIYNLCWAPAVRKTSEHGENNDILEFHTPQKVLFSLGDGKVIMHSFRQDERSINIEDIISATNNLKRKDPSRTELHFQPSHFRYMVIGSDDGSIEIFSTPNLQLLCTLKSFHQLIQSIAWHPEYVGESDIQSSYAYMLATASNEHDIHVWDVSEYLIPSSDEHNEKLEICKDKSSTQHNSSVALIAETPVFTSPSVVLSGHHQRVTYLTWSPHENTKLLSVSYDGTAQVWDVASQVPLSNFSGHNGRLVCGLWSPLDTNHVFTGGEDCTLYEWNIKKQKNTLPVRKATRKKSRRKEDKLIHHDLDKENPFKSSNDVKELDTFGDKENNLLNYQDTKLEIEKMGKSINTTPQQLEKICFPISYQYENRTRQTAYDECQKLYDIISFNGNLLHEETSDECTKHVEIDTNLSLFASRANIDDFVEAEKDCLNVNGKFEAVCHLTQYSGDLKKLIEQASQTGKLSDWLVSASAGISYSFWRQMCELYAVQLGKSNEILKACSYHLMTHDVQKAIEVLKRNHFYRSAIVLIKSRLPHDAPILKEVYKSWAYQATEFGNYELASKCCIAAGDYLQAANLLAKRPTTSSLRVASYLALKSGEEGKSRIFANQCATQCIKNNDWTCMEQLVKETSDVNISRMWEDSKDLRNNNISEKITSIRQNVFTDSNPNDTETDVTSDNIVSCVDGKETFFDCD